MKLVLVQIFLLKGLSVARIAVASVLALTVLGFVSESHAGQRFRYVQRPGYYSAVYPSTNQFTVPFGAVHLGGANFGAVNFGVVPFGAVNFGTVAVPSAGLSTGFGSNNEIYVPAGAPGGTQIFAVHRRDRTAAGGLSLSGYVDSQNRSVDQSGRLMGLGKSCAGSSNSNVDSKDTSSTKPEKASQLGASATSAERIKAAMDKLDALDLEPR